MAKTQVETSNLEARIAELAQSFAQEVVALIHGATMEDLLRLGSAVQSGQLRLSAPLIGRTTLIAPIKRKRSWPTCGEPGCQNSYYPASGTARLCYKHFLASGGRHPSKK